jgi:formylglycine-generating enzyme required for sulfatase activity
MAAMALAASLLAALPGPPVSREPLTGMLLVLLPPGEFAMGSPPGEAGREPGETLHRVRLTRPFEIGRTEVTQDQWFRVMRTRPSHFRDCGGGCPVESVTWFEAREFVERLSELTGSVFRLPTEAEWEYACRAGTSTPFSTGENLTTAQANYDGGYPLAGFPPGVSRGRPTPAAAFAPNARGLFDMHGDVWEWTEDAYCPYGPGPAQDPIGACESLFRVIRGGSWYFDTASARSALRYAHRPQDCGFSLGFRVVREVGGAAAR